jgi:hypothetical protein
MDLVQFECGHCQKLMAVSAEHQGQHVRCPHCQQVVVAPPPAAPEPAPAPAAEPSSPAAGGAQPLFAPAPVEDHEDIFSGPEDPEDLFGEPRAPRLELPPTAPAPAPQPEVNGSSARFPVEAAPPEEPAPEPALPPAAGPSEQPDPTIPQEHPVSSGPEDGVFPWASPETTGAAVAAADSPGDAGASLGLAMDEPGQGTAEVGTAAARRPSRERRQARSLFVPLILIPLVFYAAGATFFVGWSIFKVQELQNQYRQLQNQQQQQNPFDALPDDGDNPGVVKGGKRISHRTIHFPDRYTTGPLPPPQRMTLGQTRRLGFLEVTPISVERKRVAVVVRGSDRPEPCRNDSLVLRLKLRNVSTDQAFAPLDNYFDRSWKPGQGDLPLTHLEAAGRCFCGPAHWHPQSDRGADRPEWLEGRAPTDAADLAPGAAMESYVSTDGNDEEAVRLLLGERKTPGAPPPFLGPFLWRVRLRRGLIEWDGKPRSATTVIGVEFTRSDIGKEHKG